jgi:hypothetical protein
MGGAGTQTATVSVLVEKLLEDHHIQQQLKNTMETAWSSGGSSMNTARAYPGLGGAGTQTAALAIGGDTFPGPSCITNGATEEYNGN